MLSDEKENVIRIFNSLMLIDDDNAKLKWDMAKKFASELENETLDEI